MKLDTLKKKLNSLRASLARKGFGSEVKQEKRTFFFIVRTTESTGFFSKKNKEERLKIDNDFLNRSDFLNQKLLLDKLLK